MYIGICANTVCGPFIMKPQSPSTIASLINTKQCFNVFAFPAAKEANYIKSVFFIIGPVFGICLAVCETTVKWVITEGEIKHIKAAFCDFFFKSGNMPPITRCGVAHCSINPTSLFLFFKWGAITNGKCKKC